VPPRAFGHCQLEHASSEATKPEEVTQSIGSAAPFSQVACSPAQAEVLPLVCRMGGPPMERPNEENKLFVGHLPADVTEEDLRTVFTTYGEVSNIHLMNGKISDRGHACAFVSYVKQEAAEDAIAVLDGKYKIRDSPDAEFIKVNWKKQGDRSGKGDDKGGKGGDKGGGWSGGQQGGSSWSGGQQDSWKPNSWGGAIGASASQSNNSAWNQGHQGGNQWSSPQAPASWAPQQSSSWGSNAGKSWNSSAGNGWDSGSGGNSWQDGGSWGGGKGSKDGKGKGGDKGWGKDSGKGGKDSGKGDSWGQSDWRGGDKGGDKGKSAPEPSNRLFVGNLPADIKEESLTYVFGTYGKVATVHVMAGKAKSGQACAFIEMGTVEEAETAIATLHEKYEIRPGDGPIMVKFGKPGGKGKDRSSPY